MKKINQNILANISLELSPLSEDNEGLLRGGFAGLGGNDIDAENKDYECVNKTCNNTSCNNTYCYNDHCDNDHCSNDHCGLTTKSPDGTKNDTGLLI